MIEEQVLNATKNLLADEMIEVTLQFDSKVATAENRLTALEVSIASKDTDISQLKQRFEVSIAAKDTEIGQLKQQFGGLERSIALKDTEIRQLKQRFGGLERSIALILNQIVDQRVSALLLFAIKVFLRIFLVVPI